MARKGRIKMVNAITLEEAMKHTKTKGTKLVWLGIESSEYISKVLNIEESAIASMDPEEIIYADVDKISRLKDHVFVCYHGNTSGFLVDYLDQKNIEAYHLKGGVVSIVGDIF